MTTLPVDVAALARAAVESFPAALRDDPTLWPAGDATMPSEVSAVVLETVRDNFRSLLARNIGGHVPNIASDMETAIADDGPLADLSEVWSAYVTGLDLEDYSAVIKAKDWDARVEVLNDQIAALIHGHPAPPVTAAEIDAYAASDPRLGALVVSQKHECAAPFSPPADRWDRKENYTGTLAQDAAQRAAPRSIWDDEDEPAAPAAPISDRRSTPVLFQMLEPIGVLATDVADIIGVSKATISNAKSGKRPWTGLTEKQAHKLADELDARSEAALALSRRLRALDPVAVDGNNV